MTETEEELIDRIAARSSFGPGEDGRDLVRTLAIDDPTMPAYPLVLVEYCSTVKVLPQHGVVPEDLLGRTNRVQQGTKMLVGFLLDNGKDSKTIACGRDVTGGRETFSQVRIIPTKMISMCLRLREA